MTNLDMGLYKSADRIQETALDIDRLMHKIKIAMLNHELEKLVQDGIRGTILGHMVNLNSEIITLSNELAKIRE